MLLAPLTESYFSLLRAVKFIALVRFEISFISFGRLAMRPRELLFFPRVDEAIAAIGGLLDGALVTSSLSCVKKCWLVR